MKNWSIEFLLALLRSVIGRGRICLMPFAFSIVLSTAGGHSFAQEVRAAFVSSTNDGNGLFSYTISKGNAPGVWGITGDAFIAIQSHGILEVFSPPGWTATVDSNELIVWRVTSGIVFIEDSPLTFSVRSFSTEGVLYDGPFYTGYTGLYPSGMIVGNVFTIPDHILIGGGYEAFTMVGPLAVPEPSTIGLLAIGILIVARSTKRRLK